MSNHSEPLSHHEIILVWHSSDKTRIVGNRIREFFDAGSATAVLNRKNKPAGADPGATYLYVRVAVYNTAALGCTEYVSTSLYVSGI